MKKIPRCAALVRAVLLLIAFSFSVAPRAATGSPPEVMSYQGYLTDGAGVPLANVDPPGPLNFDMVFRIYDAATGSNRHWSEKQTVTVDKGYFSVVLGLGSAVNGEPNTSTNFAGIFTSSDRFLEITVKAAAGGADLVIQPRLQLLPTGYSFLSTRAKNIDAAANMMNRLNSQTLFLASDTNSFLGYNNASSTFNGSTADGPRLVGLTGGLLGTGSGPSEKVAVRWDSNGRVAVNKLSATTALDVEGTVTATGFSGPFVGGGAGITNINAVNISAGVLDTTRIPDLDAAKITTGFILDARLNTNVVRTSGNPIFDPGILVRTTNYGVTFRTNSFGTLGRTLTNDGIVIFGKNGGILGVKSGNNETGVVRWSSVGMDVVGQNSKSTNQTTSFTLALGQFTVHAGDPDNPGPQGPSPANLNNTFISTNSRVAIGLANYVSVQTNNQGVVLDYHTEEYGVIQAYDAASSTTPMWLNPIGGAVFATISSPSDRNIKTGFKEIDSRSILDKVASLPVMEWSYTNSASTIHLGPVAQDFKAVFGLGGSDKAIDTVDAQGVALAAIKGLNDLVREKDSELQAVKREMQELRGLIEKLAQLNAVK